jgi:hypothetical protein
MRAVTRLQAIAILTWMLVASAVLVALGLSDWNPWAQLGAVLAVLIVGTGFAPGYFGWRQPRGDH